MLKTEWLNENGNVECTKCKRKFQAPTDGTFDLSVPHICEDCNKMIAAGELAEMKANPEAEAILNANK